MSDTPTSLLTPTQPAAAQPSPVTIHVVNAPSGSLGPSASVPAAGGVTPASQPTLGPVATPAAPAAPLQTTEQLLPSSTTVPLKPPIQQPAAQTFTFNDGKTYDQSGNRVEAGGNPSTPGLGTQGGLAGLSPTDFLTAIGSKTALNQDEINQIRNELGIPAAEQAAFQLPSQSTVDVYQQGYDQAGLGDVKQQILSLNDQITQARKELSDAVTKENENPFLSEASRVGRLQTLQEDGNNRINDLLNQQSSLQNIYANGVNELNNLVTRHTNDFSTEQTTNQAKLTHLLSLAEQNDTAAVNAKISRYIPDYLQSSAQAKTPSTINTPNGASFYYDKNQGKFVQLTGPVGSFDQYTNPITGQTGILNKQTGQVTYPDGSTGTAPTSSSSSGGATFTPDSGGSFPQGAQQQPGSAAAVNNVSGVKDPTTGQFVQYQSPAQSFAATVQDIQNKQSGKTSTGLNGSSTLSDFVNTWVNGKPNVPAVGYTADNVANYLQKIGVQGATAQTPIGQLDATQLASAVAHFETGYSPNLSQQTPQATTASEITQPTQQQQPDNSQSQQVQISQAFNNLASTFTDANQRAYARYVLNNYMQSGDIAGAWNYLKTQAINHLDPAQQDAYNKVSDGIDSLQGALTVLNNHPELSTGPYQNIVQSAKPWLGQNKNQDYANFKQAADYGATLIQNKFFGARLTDAEIKRSESFLPNANDTRDNVINKLKGSVAMFQYVNDKQLAQKLGTPLPSLDQYLAAAGYQQ